MAHGMRERVRRDAERDEKARREDPRAWALARRLDMPYVVLGLAVVPLIVVEWRAEGGVATTARVLYDVVWASFVVMEAAQIVVSQHRLRWIRRRALELVLIVVSNPAAPAVLQLFRSLSAFRIFGLRRMQQIVNEDEIESAVFSGGGVRWAVVLTAVVIVGGGWLFAQVESSQHLTTGDGVWFALVTAATVGYGDIVPTTTAGRIIASVVMVSGVALVGLLTGAIAQRFLFTSSAQDDAVLARLDELSERLARIEGAQHPPDAG